MADRYTIAAVNNALKVVALPRIQKQFNNTSFLLNKMKRGVPKLTLGGRSIDLSLKVGGSASFRTLDEMEVLPGAKTARYKLASIPTKTAAAQFSISKQAMLAAKGQEKAWIDVQSEAMSDTTEQFGQRLSQMFFRDGTGAVARVDTTPGAITATTFYVAGDQETGGDRTFGSKYVIEDMDVSFSANLTGKSAERNASARITIIDDTVAASPLLTIDPSTGDIADDDYVFIGSKTATSKNRDFMGLFGICDDGTNLATLQGIDRTAAGNSFWKGNLYSSLAAADLENRLRIAADDIQRRNMGKPGVILTSYGVYRRFSNQLTPGRRFVAAAESQEYKTGISELGWAYGPSKNIPIEVDKDCPAGCMFLLDMSTLVLGTMGEPTWLDDDGDVLKWDPGLLAYVGVYYAFGELICYAPNRNALLEGITED